MPNFKSKMSVAIKLRQELNSALDQDNWPRVARVDARIKELLRVLTTEQKRSKDILALKAVHNKALDRAQRELVDLQDKINAEHNNRDGLRAYHGLEK